MDPRCSVSGDTTSDHYLEEIYFVGIKEEIDFSEMEYKQEDISENENDEEDLVDDNMSPTPPPYSPLSSTSRRGNRNLSSTDDEWESEEPRYLVSSKRDRSRSPHHRQRIKSEPLSECHNNSGIAIGIHEEIDAAPISAEFFTPDAHEVFACLPDVSNDNVNRVKGNRLASVGNVRRRGCGRLAGGTRGDRWRPGDPLQFVYITDADVPPELTVLANDVIRTREERMHVTRARTASRNQEGLNKENHRESQGGEFLDVTDGLGHTQLDDEHLRFDWSSADTFRGKEETFRPQRTGWVHRVESAYDAFRSYWDDDILQYIVDQTNDYASKITSAGFGSEWQPTNVHEILCVFAFWTMLGVIRMPTEKSCFATHPILKTEVFSRIFTRSRYGALTRALSFLDADPSESAFRSISRSAADSDRLYSLRPILDHLNLKFKENYSLSKDICIDESHILWKGKEGFQQYIWSKAVLYGIKTFELCESATGYLWSFIVYTGKQRSAPTSTSVVMKLIEPLLNKGHRLFLDHIFNSPLMARYLKLNRTDCVGAVRPTQLHVPVLLKEAPLKQGQFTARQSGDVCVLAWQDQDRVTMLSTCHGAHTALPRVLSEQLAIPQLFKPQMVLDFDNSKRAVDLKDHLLRPYLVERFAKWDMKLFKRLLNCSILNARILLQSSLGLNQDHLDFRLKLANVILSKHLHQCPSSPCVTSCQEARPNQLFDHTHWPVRLKQTPYEIKHNAHHRKNCIFCYRYGKKSKTTAYMCESCKVPLCVVDCFKSYHLSINNAKRLTTVAALSSKSLTASL